ncbi:MAG: alpha/beta fold hydrolase [Sphingomonas sp.]
MSSVRIGSGRMIGYDQAGGGGATPIVFLHGVGSDKSVWHPQLAYFGRSRRAIAFDYPGYGDSDPAGEGASRDDFAEAILSAMHELGVTRAHICGLSLGVVVAIALYTFDPRACASLILADGFAVHPDGRAIYERSLAGSRNLPAMAEARVDLLLAQPAEAEVRREVVNTMSNIDPAAYRTGAEAVWLADQRGRAGAIRAPTLVLVGDQDLITPVDLSSELVDLIPDSRMQLIAGAGHLSNLEKPAEFNALVERFIEALD